MTWRISCPTPFPWRRALPPIVAALLALAAGPIAGTARAQSRPVSPVYYLVTSPELTEGEPIEDALDEQDGHNFKDGSRVDVVKMRGTAGEPVVVEALSEVIDTHLTLYGPDGSIVAVNDDGPTGLDARIAMTFPTDGTYLVMVSGFGPDDLGPYRLVRSRPAAVEAEPLPLPGEHYTTLEADMIPAEDLASGPSRDFRLELQAPMLLMVTAISSDIDTVLGLYDENDQRVAYNDDSDLGTDSRLFAELEPGRYRLVLAAYGPGSAGDVRLDVQGYRPVD